jgi:Protein of unknown function (DUF4245)
VIRHHGGVSTDAQSPKLPDDAATVAVDPQLRAEWEQAQELKAERKIRRVLAPWTSMVLSLGAVLVLVLGVILLVPRVSRVTQPPVNIAFGARVAAEQLNFEPALPAGLPPSWRPTSVRTTKTASGVLTWHIGYQTATGDYAAVEQAEQAPASWLRQQTNRGAAQGELPIAGESWSKWVRTDKLQNSLSRTEGTVTTVVTGTASFTELVQLAVSLRPAPAQ